MAIASKQTKKASKKGDLNAHRVQLIDGVFTAQEAGDVISSLMNEKINFHKLHRLSLTERDYDCDVSFDNSRLCQLKEDLVSFKEYIQEIKYTGKKLKINAVVQIELED